MNGDGMSDFLIADPIASESGYQGSGLVRSLSFRPGLRSNNSSLSAAMGGSLLFEIDLPEDAAGYLYKLAFSASGSGEMWGGIPIPLKEDLLVHRSFHGDYPFTNYWNLHGFLNSSGDAGAAILVGPHELGPHLIGRSLHVSAIASPTGLRPAEFCSVALPLEIIP